METHGTPVKKLLFIHACVAHNFNVSLALRFTQISKSALDQWLNHDMRFVKLFEEVKFHLGSFYENALVNLVKKGDTAAILFANRTFNRDRGYADNINVNVSGTVNHAHAHIVAISDLDLSLEDQKKILDKLRDNKKYKELLEVNGDQL